MKKDDELGGENLKKLEEFFVWGFLHDGSLAKMMMSHRWFCSGAELGANIGANIFPGS